MHAAVLASVTLDGGTRVEIHELVAVGGYFEVGDGHDADDGKERPGGLPALGTPAGVVVEDVAGDGHFDSLTSAVAFQRSSREVIFAFCKAIVDEWMK